MLKVLRRFLKDDHGATAVEYALIVGVIALGLLGVLSGIAGSLNNLFQFFAGFFGG